MDATHVHLVLTHFPIVGTLIGIFILAVGLFQKNRALKNTAFFIFLAMALVAIPVFLTGEDAEETVENLAGVSENMIHEHEELAETAIWLIEILGAMALFNVLALAKGYSFARITTIVSFVFALVTFGIFVQVGNLGGQIRHSEIRANGAQTEIQGQGDNQTESSPFENDDDDD